MRSPGAGIPICSKPCFGLRRGSCVGATLILVAGFTDGARTWIWIAAIAVTYGGAAWTGSTGWRVHPGHFAERYGLVLIIALGEAFIAIGIGATGTGIGLGRDRRGDPRSACRHLLLARVLRFLRDPRRANARAGEGPDRVALARDVYTFFHFPMIVGIVLFAFAMKIVVGHVGDELTPSQRSRSAAEARSTC